jgi:XRE family aerobic/anaerobic benzoate catabolism transcriptional regulator
MGEITNFKGEALPVNPPDETEEQVQVLLARVGERVRKARDLKGVSRRILSETSGVSPRYLAQLEAGDGNISIGLLTRIALALDLRIEWLLIDDDPWTSDVIRVTESYRVADALTRQKVRAALNPDQPDAMRASRVCLIGLRGAGKSTLGRLAAERLKTPFVELNREIEDQSGMTISELLALYGQEGYRKLESQALSRVVATHETVILAVAGGIVAEPETYNQLLKSFHTVWLRATPDEHMNRVRAQGDTRPMAGNPEAMEQLRAILTSRETLYSRAEAEIDTSGRTVDQSLDALISLIEDRHFLSAD